MRLVVGSFVLSAWYMVRNASSCVLGRAVGLLRPPAMPPTFRFLSSGRSREGDAEADPDPRHGASCTKSSLSPAGVLALNAHTNPVWQFCYCPPPSPAEGGN